MIFLIISGDGDSRCWLLGGKVGGIAWSWARAEISRVEIRHFNQRLISWRLIAFMNYPYLIAEISWSSGSLLSDRWWTNDQVCSGSVPFRFSKLKRGWTNYLRQHMRQHAVLVFLGASRLVRWWEGFWPHESSTNQKEGHDIRICFFYRCTPHV